MLPAFYLIDAISKNVFEPYAKRFASIVTPLFLQTYNQSDDQTRNKMEEMLLTWRDGSPHRREVFGPVTQLAIERGVWGDGKVASVSVPGTRLVPPVKRGRKKITRGQVLSELQYAIGRRERELQTNPYDQEARTKLEVMQQVSIDASLSRLCINLSLASSPGHCRCFTGRIGSDRCSIARTR